MQIEEIPVQFETGTQDMVWQNKFLSSLGFTKSKADSHLYYKVEDSNPVMLLLYVDHLFVTGTDGLIADTKRKLAAEFKMEDLGMMHYF